MKISAFITMMVAAYSLIACVSETDLNEAIVKEIILTAYHEHDTKTTITNQTKVYWKPEDEIKVFSAGESAKFISQNTENAAIADFKGMISVVPGDAEDFGVEDSIYALYPYREDASISNGVIATFLPAVQTAAAGTFADDLFISIGRSNSLSIPFYNVCSGIRFTVERADIEAIELKGNNGEILCGSFLTRFGEEDKPIVAEVSSTETIVRLLPPPGRASFMPGENYFIVTLPQSFTQGITLSFIKDGYKADKIITSPITLQRSVFGTLVSVDRGCKYYHYVDQERLKMEREALIAIYHALDGDNWINNENWCSNKPVGEWSGVTTTYYGGYVRTLSFEGEEVFGVIPKELENLTSLYYLSLRQTNIKGFEVSSEMPNITYISSQNNVSLSLLDFLPLLSHTPNLEFFDLIHESYSPERLITQYQFPSELLNLAYLKSLIMSCCNITGGIPEQLYNMSTLERLSMDSCPVGGILSSKVSNLINLNFLFLRDCGLEGSIPQELSILMNNNLDICNLSYNRLSGSIHNSISSHPKWKMMWGDIITGNAFDFFEQDIPIPEFNIVDYAGREVNSEEIYEQSRYLLIYQHDSDVFSFYSFAAPPLNHIKSIYDRYHNNGLYVLTLEAESVQEHKIESVANDYGLKWPICRLYQENSIFGKHYYPTSTFPYVTIIDCEEKKVVFASGFHDYFELDPCIMGLFGDASYLSTDYSQNGEVTKIMSAETGRGINIIIMGDGFSDRQIADGTYASVMQKAADAFFSEEPYKSMKDRFNVYTVNVVSTTEGCEHIGQALGTLHGSGANIYGNDAMVIEYAKEAVGEDRLDDALVIVMMNEDAYAGTCYMYNGPSGDYGRGLSIAYFPTSSDTDIFNGLVSHEAGGHGFAKLADEYAYDYMGAIPDDVVANTRVNESYGWWKNVDFTNDPVQVKWSSFISDTRYANESLGCYEGGLTYWTGVWRPTENSIMRYNTGGFNAPSRYAIWYRINKLAYGENWNGTYEDFVSFDAPNRTPAAAARRAAKRPNYVEKQFQPLAPPVVVGHSWREALQKK